MTDHTTTGTHPAVPARGADHVPPPARTALAVGLAAAPLFLVGQALLPSLPMDLPSAYAAMAEDRERVLAARLVTGLGAFLFLPAVLALARLVPRDARGRRTLLTGAALAAVGTSFNGLSQVAQGYGTHAATAPGVDPTSGQVVVGALGTGLSGLPIGYWSVPVFAVGLLVVAVALLLSRRVGAVWPSVLLVGLLLAFATAGTGPLVALTFLPFVLSCCRLQLVGLHRTA